MSSFCSTFPSALDALYVTPNETISNPDRSYQDQNQSIPRCGSSNPQLVVIIGAGASGIGAARMLQDTAVSDKRNIQVVILEARNRIGGRVHRSMMTKNLESPSGRKNSNMDENLAINLGANWIHALDEHVNPLYALSQKLGFELYCTTSDDEPGDDVMLFDSEVLGEEGRFGQVALGDYERAIKRYEWIKDYVEEAGIDGHVECGGSHYSNSDGLTDISYCYSKTNVTAQQAFEEAITASVRELGPVSSSAELHCIYWFLDRVAIDLAADLGTVSHASYIEGEGFPSGEALMTNGASYTKLLGHLVQFPSPLNIKLETIVTSISVPVSNRSGSQQVSIVCENGEVYHADACIVTVPVGVLQANAIRFEPHAPTRIQQLCASLQMGLMNLVWLWYPFCFWPADTNFLGVAHAPRQASPAGSDAGASGVAGPESEEDVHRMFTTFLAPPMFDNQGQRQAVLMCQVVGAAAEALESMTEEQVAARATAVLRGMFGAAQVPDAVGCSFSAWHREPFTRGSWSKIPYHSYDVDKARCEKDGSESTEKDSTGSSSAGQNQLRSGSSRSCWNCSCVPCVDKGEKEKQEQEQCWSEEPLRPQNCSTAAITGIESVSFIETSISTSKYNDHLVLDGSMGSVLSGDSCGGGGGRSRSNSRVSALSTEGDSRGQQGPGGSVDRDRGQLLPADHEVFLARHSACSLVDSRVFYAGEADCEWQRGSVHGAYLSGLNTARRTLDSINQFSV